MCSLPSVAPPIGSSALARPRRRVRQGTRGALRRPCGHRTRTQACLRTSRERLVRSPRRPFSSRFAPPTGLRVASEACEPPNPLPNMPANLPQAFAAIAGTAVFRPFSTCDSPPRPYGGVAVAVSGPREAGEAHGSVCGDRRNGHFRTVFHLWRPRGGRTDRF